jgi:hypothetical protein
MMIRALLYVWFAGGAIALQQVLDPQLLSWHVEQQQCTLAGSFVTAIQGTHAAKKKGLPFLGRQPFGTATANWWPARRQPLQIEENYGLNLFSGLTAPSFVAFFAFFAMVLNLLKVFFNRCLHSYYCNQRAKLRIGALDKLPLI